MAASIWSNLTVKDDRLDLRSWMVYSCWIVYCSHAMIIFLPESALLADSSALLQIWHALMNLSMHFHADTRCGMPDRTTIVWSEIRCVFPRYPMKLIFSSQQGADINIYLAIDWDATSDFIKVDVHKKRTQKSFGPRQHKEKSKKELNNQLGS